MASKQVEQLEEWSELLKQVRSDEAELAGVSRYRNALEKAHAEAQCARNRRDALQASTMEATRRLNETLAQGRDAAIALRSFLRGALGARSERLCRYGVKPLRKRRRA